MSNMLSNPGFIGLLATLVIAPVAVVAILVFSPKQTKQQANTNKYKSINKWHRRLIDNPITRTDYMRLVEMKSCNT